MHPKRLLLGLAAGIAIAAAAAFTPSKQAVADGGWDCFKYESLGPCGCPEKCFNNCTCPTAEPPARK